MSSDISSILVLVKKSRLWQREREREVKLKLKASGRATGRAVGSGRIVTSAYVTIDVELETEPILSSTPMQ